MKIDEAYAGLCLADTDIKPHMGTLKRLAEGRRVVEFGTRRGVSTIALLAAIPKPVFVDSYDLERSPDIDGIEEMAREAGILFRFKQEDIDKLDSIDPCDFVFIDAMHNGNSVAIHLRLANEAGAKFIALHDTEIFARRGDLAGTPGIMDAVDNFMACDPRWSILQHSPESYGFTVLSRK